MLFNYVSRHSCRWHLGCALLKMPAVPGYRCGQDNVSAFAKTEGLAWPYNLTSKADLFQQFEAGCAQHEDGGIVALSEGRLPKTMADFKTALGL